MKRVLQAITALSLVYTIGMTALGNLPAWKHLPDRPISITTGSCPATPIALAADPELITPLVLANSIDRGGETPAATESCRRMTALVRADDPFYELVPARFICANIRRHAHALWLEADLWPGPHLWIIDGKVTGAGRSGFADELRAAGVRYAVRDDGVVEIVATR